MLQVKLLASMQLSLPAVHGIIQRCHRVPAMYKQLMVTKYHLKYNVDSNLCMHMYMMHFTYEISDNGASCRGTVQPGVRSCIMSMPISCRLVAAW
jgi:hypothetical protein